MCSPALCLPLLSNPLAAQAARFEVAEPSPAAIAIPDSARGYPPTYWKAGLVAGAAVGALIGAGLAGGLCSLDERDTSACFGATIGGALVFATGGGTVGALVGSLFPRKPPSNARRYRVH